MMKLRPLSFLLALTLLIGSSQTTSLAQDQKSTTKAKKTKKAPRKPNPAMAKIEDQEGLPRVLLLGDSISIGYTVGVRELLKGKANVHRALTNCGPTSKGVSEIRQWLQTGGGDKKWDVIHFNWGLHDLKYMGPKGENLQDPADPKNKQQVPPEEYKKNLITLVEILQTTGANLIWRNTTPVPEGAKGRVVGDSEKYNKIADAIMKEHNIPTNDLFSLTKNNPAWMLPANVHYTAEGSKGLAKDVAATIEGFLPKK